ncbi:GNAT family N-acetyltransferase [Kineococcus sp. DHX-1]|uniref:GNAT family N-acetyltransferase n=1 Tax=Kineococcus sp. DHX-1 TaxID=3349638 RepID=UPI0036D2111F
MNPASSEAWGVARYGNPCTECGWSWPAGEEAVQFVEGVAEEFAHALAGRDGATRHPDHGWTVAGYVAHVGDNLRQWAERLAEALAGEDRLVAAYDPDALGRARGYDVVTAEGALWSLRHSASAWGEVLRDALARGIVLRHATRGEQRAVDVAGNNAHDAFHHVHDVRRALDLPGRPVPRRAWSGAVALRPSTPADADAITRWLADPAVHRWWGGRPLSREEVLAKYCGAREPDVTVFVVEVAGRPAGVVQVWQDAERPGAGGVDVFLAADEQGRGTGPVVARLLATHLLRRGWTSVTADPAEGNPRALAAWRRAGFVPTGATGEDDGHRTVLLEFGPG